MLFAHLLFYLLLPHALGAASTLTAQIALCAQLAFILAYYYLKELRFPPDSSAFLNCLVVPAAIITLLSNTGKSEEWTLHIATIMLPMVLTPTEQSSGNL